MIRIATENDIHLIQHLAETIWWDHFSSIISREQIIYMLGWMYSKEKIAQEMADGVTWIIKYDDSHQPLGYCAYGPSDDSGKWKLNKLYVLPEAQNQGVGRTLMDYVFSKARENTVSKIMLTVNRGNTSAYERYLHMGFVVTDTMDLEIGQGFVMDDYIMELSLD